jgi:cobalamin biosynthesis protein CobD/CbiB
MTFFSVLLALIIEQVRALSPNNPVSALLQYHAESAAHGFDAGKPKHGLLAWLVVVVPWTLAVALVYYVLYHINFVLAFLWNVVIVYFTLGFRQFSHYFTDIHLALNNDDVPRAREILNEWTGLDTVDMRWWRRTATCSACSSGSLCQWVRPVRCCTGSPSIWRGRGRARQMTVLWRFPVSRSGRFL